LDDVLETLMIFFPGRRALVAAVMSLLAGTSVVHAAADARVEQRLHEEVQSVLVRMIQSGELSAQSAADLSLQAPAGRQAAFGAYFDVRHRAAPDADGIAVLGVAPGGSAAALGMLAGDRLIAVDGVSLVGLGADDEGRARALQPLRERLLQGDDGIELTVVRDGAERVLRGTVLVVDLPAYRLDLGAALAQAALAAEGAGDGESTCGRISVFDIAPRSEHLYAAVLIAVDGKLPGPSDSDTQRVTPGRHVLRVAEAIDPRQFGGLLNRQRDGRRSDRYKEIELDVQPGITYRLAARFNLEQRNSVRDGAYWEPVIWKESPERCR
jgi:hypothetical protein